VSSPFSLFSAVPPTQGLYDPSAERDACGVAFVARLTGGASHEVVQQALTALRNLDHRGASGAEPDSGDGAGILLQVPDAFLRAVVPFDLPTAGSYATGIAFIADDDDLAAEAKSSIDAIAAAEGLRVLGWRDVPVDPSLVGSTARGVMPRFAQVFVEANNAATGLELERLAYVLRRRSEHEVAVYFASLSSRTLVYKGMLTTGQLEPFYPDLSDPRVARALALVH